MGIFIYPIRFKSDFLKSWLEHVIESLVEFS